MQQLMPGLEVPNPCWVHPDVDPDSVGTYWANGYALAIVYRSKPDEWECVVLGTSKGKAATMEDAREFAISNLRTALKGINASLGFLLK